MRRNDSGTLKLEYRPRLPFGGRELVGDVREIDVEPAVRAANIDRACRGNEKEERSREPQATSIFGSARLKFGSDEACHTGQPEAAKNR